MEKSQSLYKKSRLFLKFYKISREYQEIKTKFSKSWQYQENQENQDQWTPWILCVRAARFKSTTSRYRANFTLTSSFWRWRHYRVVRKNMKNFKYCTISLNMLHTDGLCGVLRFTAPLSLISKKSQSRYIYTLNSDLCAPIAWAAIKQLHLGAWELPKNLIRPPG